MMLEEKFPIGKIVPFTAIAFIAIITELLPAGVLVEMAKDLQVPMSGVGRLVSFYAIGTVLTAIPAAAISRNISRKPLLIFVLSGFLIANLFTAYSQNYYFIAFVRILVGGFGGILWPLITGYAARLVSAKNTGKALAVVMAGSTIALCVGLPLATFLGQLIGWRGAFTFLSVITLFILCWTVYHVPSPKESLLAEPSRVLKVLAMPGTALVLFTTYIASSAIYISYTYLAPILTLHGIGGQVGFALLLFGAGAVAGILVTGKFIDRYMRRTLILSMVSGALSLFIVGLAGHSTFVIYISITIWGYSFGGLPSLLQTATIGAARGAYELGSSMTVTVYNIGVFSGGVIGGLILDSAGAYQLSWVSFFMIVIVIVLIIVGKTYAFPKKID